MEASVTDHKSDAGASSLCGKRYGSRRQWSCKRRAGHRGKHAQRDRIRL